MKWVVQIFYNNKWLTVLGGDVRYFRQNGFVAREFRVVDS